MAVITKKIEVNPDLTVTIRKLSYLQVKRAKDTRLSEVIARGKEMKDLRDLVSEERATGEAAAIPPEQSYDQQLTLHAGIVAWSLDDDPTPGIIDDVLGPEEADIIFREIVAFCERPADEKKDSAGAFKPVLVAADGPQS